MKSLLVFFLILMLGNVRAENVTFFHHDIPKTVVLEETGDILTLRGVALQKVFFRDNYLGAFYSLNRLTSAHQALQDASPQRMWLYFLRPVDNLREYWIEGIEENNSPEIVDREQISLSQFYKMIDLPLRAGDTLVLDYMPNVGTKVTVKGVVKGTIKGNEFYDLVLKVWMGRLPPSEKFRKDLFNLS